MTGESLTKTSDQTIEAAHQFVDKVIQRSSYAVKDVTCKEHGDKLLQGKYQWILINLTFSNMWEITDSNSFYSFLTTYLEGKGYIRNV